MSVRILLSWGTVYALPDGTFELHMPWFTGRYDWRGKPVMRMRAGRAG